MESLQAAYKIMNASKNMATGVNWPGVRDGLCMDQAIQYRMAVEWRAVRTLLEGVSQGQTRQNTEYEPSPQWHD